METLIDKRNVGRIAERIVANELEARGFRVTDLNRQGLAANADLLATFLFCRTSHTRPSDRLVYPDPSALGGAKGPVSGHPLRPIVAGVKST
jgi:hypothetical protein